MRAIRTNRERCANALVAISAVAFLAAGCGEDDFANEPRPAVPVELTGVIQDDAVTVSPGKVGAGPILITISNQTDDAHTVILDGESVREQVGPINPLDTATIQKTLPRGEYEVRAGSETAQRPDEVIDPAVLSVGPDRKSSNDELLLP
jgi:hypothetical protein